VSYLWNTGSTNKSIVANNGGNYWLKVTDANGCVGDDSVTLSQKDCNIGVFFPTSFTPNNDGLNDLYKPKLYGRLDAYHLIIYNRYGQKLFESRNITEGWSGKFNGEMLAAEAYVWQCWYQLTGGNVQSKSGTILLIR
jgi:gliding motility-associated-like protein